MPSTAAARGSQLLAALVRTALGNPVATLGSVVMVAAAATILTNALALQPGPHPAPLFTGTRLVAPFETSSFPAQHADSITNLLGGAADVAPESYDSGLVLEIQRGLSELGYYKGQLDGLTGPQTSQAIVAFERAFSLAPNGEPSNNVLLAIKAIRARMAPPDVAAPVGNDQSLNALPPVTEAPTNDVAQAPIPLPPPKPVMVASAAPEATVAQDMGTTGSIADLISSSLPAPAPRGPVALPASDGASPKTAAPAPRAPVALPVSEGTSTLVTAEAGDPNVRRIQQSLAAQGFGPVPIDGALSAETRTAIRRFQTYYGLPASGNIDEQFLAQMIRVGGLKVR